MLNSRVSEQVSEMRYNIPMYSYSSVFMTDPNAIFSYFFKMVDYDKNSHFFADSAFA